MTERHRESPRLVVVGSSAGGVEALSVLVSNLPRDLAAPVVIAQHLDRRGPSHLIEILSRRTEMTVQAVEDKAHLEAGTIYVIPANRHVAVTDHELRFVTPTEDGPAPSVDRLLSTAADVFGEGLIAVVLTGMGSDGAAGARRVKAAGGTVIVQDPKTARFPSMPASLAPTSVDIEAPLESIGAIVRELAAELPAASEESEAAILRQLLDRLRDRTGIDFSAYKPPTILRRLQRRLVATGNPDLRQYLRYVGAHPRELDKIGASFLIKVTEFFRDAELFDHLREQLVPKLVEEARGHGRELRVWSAGCATGEEAYSLAVLISDALGVELPDWTIRIFATDLDPDAISFARRGIYPASALAHVDPQTLQRHFTQTDGEYEVRKHLRTMTVFGQHDLGARAPFPRIDLVLCRNVLIYFTPELQRRALQLFAFSLRDGGWLALGKAETTSPLAEYFTVDDSRLKLFRRRGERLLVPPAHTAEPRATAPPRPATARTAFGIENQVEAARRRSAGESAEAVLAAVPVGIIVVDASYDIKAINPAARDLLGIHGSALKRDVVHLAERLDSGALRRAIDTAKAGESSDFTATLLRLDGSSEVQTEVEISAHAAPGPPGDEQRVAILIRDVTGERARVRELETGRDAQRGDVDRLARQIDAYRETNQQLLDANRELTTENVDLRGSNEELLVANEEVQATTEEAETLNEELQATNEELETLNEELQATVEELNTTNDDMQARSLELQNMTVSLEEQRQLAEVESSRLSTVLESLKDAVAVIDAGGTTVISNSSYRRLFEEEGVTPEPTAGEAPVSMDDLRSRVARGETFLLHFRATDAAGQRRWFEALGEPVSPEMGIGEGGILVVHDTTDLSLRRLQGDFMAMVAHELRTPLTALRGYLQMLNRDGGEAAGRLGSLAAGQAERLSGLVDELFDVTRADAGRLDVQLRRVDLDTLVTNAVAIAQSLTDRQAIRLERDGRGTIVAGDPARLEQVVLNLLTNAMIHAAESEEIVVRLRKLRRWAEIEVEDRGPGIPEAVRNQLFSRFQQGRPGNGGLGLGLFLSRQIVEAHGGTLEADSEAGDGATFTVRLPLAARKTVSDEGAASRDGAADPGSDGTGPKPRRALSRRRSSSG